MSQEANYSVTVKSPRGNLITVRGDTAMEWVGNLKDAGESGALALIAGIENSLAGQPQVPLTPGGHATGAVVSPRPERPAAAVPAAGETRPAQELPAAYGVKCDTCQAAAKFEQEGVSKRSGTSYKRYSCTVNALHKATFTN